MSSTRCNPSSRSLDDSCDVDSDQLGEFVPRVGNNGDSKMVGKRCPNFGSHLVAQLIKVFHENLVLNARNDDRRRVGRIEALVKLVLEHAKVIVGDRAKPDLHQPFKIVGKALCCLTPKLIGARQFWVLLLWLEPSENRNCPSPVIGTIAQPLIGVNLMSASLWRDTVRFAARIPEPVDSSRDSSGRKFAVE